MTVVKTATYLATQPRQYIVTLYGLYARQHGDWLSVSSLVRMLAAIGVDEPSVRSSVSRLKRRGILEPERRGTPGYRLSADARSMLDEGDTRIYGHPRAAVGDGWLLVTYSVPESDRDRRHVLRSQLSRLGFGTVAPGVWIAPAHLRASVVGVLRRHELHDYVDVFRAQYLAFGDPHAKVESWWDFGSMQRMYAEFADRYRPVRTRWARRRSVPGEAAFVDYVQVLTAWRQLPYVDPGLPLELLPRGWRGADAAALFDALRSKLAAPAESHAADLLTP